MNSVNIIGRLTKEPELQHTPGGKSVLKVSVALNDGYKENQKSYFFDVQIWDKSAENVAKYVKKGDRIGLSGKLVQDRWQDKDGNKRSKVYVNAFQIFFIETKSKPNEAQPNQDDVEWT